MFRISYSKYELATEIFFNEQKKTSQFQSTAERTPSLKQSFLRKSLSTSSKKKKHSFIRPITKTSIENRANTTNHQNR